MSRSCGSVYFATGYNRDALKRLAPSAGHRRQGPFGWSSTFSSPRTILLRRKACEAGGDSDADGDRVWPFLKEAIEQSAARHCGAGEHAGGSEAHDSEVNVAEDPTSEKENGPGSPPTQAQLFHAVEVFVVAMAVYEELDEVRLSETNAQIWCKRVALYKDELAQITADAKEVKASMPLGLIVCDTVYAEDREALRAQTEKKLEEAQALAIEWQACAEKAVDKLAKMKAKTEWHEWEQLHPTAPPSP